MRLFQMGLASSMTLLLTLALPGSPADAAPSAKQGASKKQGKKPQGKGGELEGKRASQTPDKGLAGDITRRKEEKAKDIPALKYDDYALGVELQVASKRREQIESLQKIIDLGPSAAEAPDLTFRLAELYWEESKAFFFEANRRDDDIFRARAANDTRAVAEAEKAKKQSLDRMAHFQKLAIDQYSTIIRKYPKYARMDEVLFYLGKTMSDAGQEKNAVTVYKKLKTYMADTGTMTLTALSKNLMEGELRNVHFIETNGQKDIYTPKAGSSCSAVLELLAFSSKDAEED